MHLLDQTLNESRDRTRSRPLSIGRAWALAAVLLIAAAAALAPRIELPRSTGKRSAQPAAKEPAGH
jgi:hypothetical protein